MEQRPSPRFAFGPRNYQLMFIGLAVLAAGFVTMTLDSEAYGLGFLGITLGPILLVIGFIIEFFAIMAKPGGQISAPAEPRLTATPDSISPAPPVIDPVTAVRPTYKRS